ALRHGRQIPIEHERLMKHIVLRIWPLPPLVMRGVHSQDMVKDNHVFVAYALSGLHKIAHRLGISAYFGLWENHAKLHRCAPLIVPEPCGPEVFTTLPFGRSRREARNIVVEKDHVDKRDRYRPQYPPTHQPPPVVHITPNKVADYC